MGVPYNGTPRRLSQICASMAFRLSRLVRSFSIPLSAWQMQAMAAKREKRLLVLQKIGQCCLSFMLSVTRTPSVLFRPDRLRSQRGGTMRMNEHMKNRLRKDRPMETISIRMPQDVIEDLKSLAPVLGFSGYQPLLKAYVGQGLRKDLAKVENAPINRMVESLRRHGIDDQVIAEAVAEAQASGS